MSCCGVPVPGTYADFTIAVGDSVFHCWRNRGLAFKGYSKRHCSPDGDEFYTLYAVGAFLYGVWLINPLSWLTGEIDTILFLCIFLLVMAALYVVILRKEVLRYV